jgi:hypothetical protein
MIIINMIINKPIFKNTLKINKATKFTVDYIDKIYI